MTVTNHPHQSLSLEGDGAAGAWRVKADVEDLSVVVGECIVKNWIVVRKVHRGPQRDRKHVRCERLVFLHHLRVFRMGERWWNIQWFQPYDDTRIIQVFAHVGVL